MIKIVFMEKKHTFAILCVENCDMISINFNNFL